MLFSSELCSDIIVTPPRNSGVYSEKALLNTPPCVNISRGLFPFSRYIFNVTRLPPTINKRESGAQRDIGQNSRVAECGLPRGGHLEHACERTDDVTAAACTPCSYLYIIDYLSICIE